jgi:hypothetical protein
MVPFSTPVAMATGDFDGDGKPDVLVADNGNTTIYLLRNQWTGAPQDFGPLANVFETPVGRIGISMLLQMVVADFNSDGKDDVAFVDQYLYGVVIAMNDGTGVFPLGGVTHSFGLQSPVFGTSIAVGDFDNDKHLDVAAIPTGSDEMVAVFLNLGGTPVQFAPPILYASVPNANNVAAGDFDGDGASDLALVAPTGGGLAVLFSRNGSFFQSTPVHQPPPITSQYARIGGADFDGDGRVDLVTPQSLLLSHGENLLPEVIPIGASRGITTLAVGDFNNDRKPDVVYTSDQVYLLQNTGVFTPADGGMTPMPFTQTGNAAAGSNPYSIAVGDFNLDNKLDVAVANLSSSNVSVLLNDGAGSFLAATNYTVGASPQAIAVRDLNNDGRVDIVTANSSDLSVLIDSGNGIFNSAVSYPMMTSLNGVVIGDFNNDTYPDIAYSGGAGIGVRFNNGSGSFAGTSTPATGFSTMGLIATDLNRDGHLDLAFGITASPPHSIGILMSNGSTFAAVKTIFVGATPYTLAETDTNSDGLPELAIGTDVGLSIIRNTSR